MKHFFVFTLVTVVNALKMEAQVTNESLAMDHTTHEFDFGQVVSSEDDQIIEVEVLTEEGNIDLTVDGNRTVLDALAEQLGCEPFKLKVTFGDIAIGEGDTFFHLGIEEGGKLSARMKIKIPFDDFAAEVAQLNNLGMGELMRNVQVDANDHSKVLGKVHWNSMGIRILPDSIGGITVGGNLNLSFNKLTSLPDGIGGITVGGNLNLDGKQLTSLPDSIGWITVGGSLNLVCNRLTSLPDSIGGIKVGGSLYLDNNWLTSLPDSIGEITVGRDLVLSCNRLTTLPDCIADVTVGGSLYLRNNQLTTLPDSFANIKLKPANIFLDGNPLR